MLPYYFPRIPIEMKVDLKCLLLKVLATICQIGSAKNNCDFRFKKRRTKKEGIGRLEMRDTARLPRPEARGTDKQCKGMKMAGIHERLLPSFCFLP